MELQAKLAAFAAATNNEVFDAEYKGGEWMHEAVETHETIAQFVESSANWQERSPEKHGEIAAFPFVAWKSCQAVRGQERRSMSVIDFGEVRYAVSIDLTIFA